MAPHYIAHRINTIDALKRTPTNYGVELDLRDVNNELVLTHDPFTTGERFCDYLKHYQHGTMILNIKSERIEHKVLEAISQAGTVKDYFFLDSSFPMIHTLVKQNESNIAVRFSEYEPIESALALKGKIKWVWIDCFNVLPLNQAVYQQLKQHFKLCIVSPELQGHPIEMIASFATKLNQFPVDAICTKRPSIWQKEFSTCLDIKNQPALKSHIAHGGKCRAEIA